MIWVVPSCWWVSLCGCCTSRVPHHKYSDGRDCCRHIESSVLRDCYVECKLACGHNPIIKKMNSKYSCWVYQIRAIVVDDDSTISSYIPFRHKHIVFSFVLRVCTVSNHDLHSNIRNWSRDDLCIFAKLTPVHTTDVKDFCKIDRNHKKKTPNQQIS